LINCKDLLWIHIWKTAGTLYSLFKKVKAVSSKTNSAMRKKDKFKLFLIDSFWKVCGNIKAITSENSAALLKKEIATLEFLPNGGLPTVKQNLFLLV